jgi:hypothetical protein
MSGLATGIVKNTTSTGAPSIAVAADFPTLNQNTTGNAATATTSTNIAGGSSGSVPYQTANNSTAMLSSGVTNSVLKSNGTAAPSWSAVEKSMLSTALSNEITANTAKVSNVTHTGDVADTAGSLKVTKLNGVSLAGLTTGIVKNTTGTGEPSIATAADFPVLNQSTTGNAATATLATTATTATNIAGGAIGAVPYQTGSGATALLNAGTAGYVLKSNGSAAPSWAPVDLSSGITGSVPVSSGGTGASTFTAGVVKASGTSAFTTVSAPTGDIVGTTDAQTLTNKTLGSGTTFSTAVGVASGGTGAATFTAGVVKASGTSAFTTVAAPSGDLVGTTDTQTLTNKTLGAGTVLSGATVSLTSGVTGTLPVASGGTGTTAFSISNGILKANGTSAVTTVTAPTGDIVGTTDAQTLTNKTLGTGTVFSGQIINLTSNVSDTLPVVNGGTGASTLTGYVKGAGAAAMTASATVPVTDISGTLPVASGGTGVTTSTGSGANVLSTTPTLVTPILGTPNSGTLTNCTGLPLGTGVTGTLPVSHGGTGQSSYTVGDLLYSSGTTALSKLQSALSGNVLLSNGVATAPSYGKVGLTTHVTGVLPVANGGTGTPTSTGTGNFVLATSPTLVTPLLGTPTSGTLTSCTGLPLTTGVTGTLPVLNGGTGVTTSTGSGANVLATTPTLVTPILGTPTSGSLGNCTGLPLGTGVVGTLPVLNGGTGATTSTGSGANALATSPTLVTPLLGTPTSGTLTNCTGLPLGTGVSGVLPVANGGTGVTQSAYGECYISSGATTTIASIGVFVKVAGTTTAATLSNFTHPASNRLTYTGTTTRKFLITAALSFHGTSSNDYKFALYENGTIQLTSSVISTTGTGAGSLSHVSCRTIVDLATNDFIEVFVTNAGATNNASVDFMNVVAVAVI